MRSARTKYQKVNQDISFPGQQEQSPGQLSDSAAYQSQHQTNKIPISPFLRQYLIFQISMKSYLPKYKSTLIKISQLLINMLKKKNFTFTSCTLTFLIIAEFSKFSAKDSIFFFHIVLCFMFTFLSLVPYRSYIPDCPLLYIILHQYSVVEIPLSQSLPLLKFSFSYVLFVSIYEYSSEYFSVRSTGYQSELQSYTYLHMWKQLKNSSY